MKNPNKKYHTFNQWQKNCNYFSKYISYEQYSKNSIGRSGRELFALYEPTKKNKTEKVYLAPDGNTYEEDQIYRTYDNKLYKNGKEFYYNLPNQHDELISANMNYIAVNKNVPLNHNTNRKNTAYHHKGVRHH
ncbi:hypothetical protein [uncultured Chryseobacterium sp.]|uniref:hypothetical protein n=1 Tax=uncultured Chryseobacterium sp. TaxID=259322 RepID=UPI002587F445|nr:hypothetical protein [uncultured Chryseobacterium sp.]